MSKQIYNIIRLLTLLKVFSTERFIDAQIDARHAVGEFDNIETAYIYVRVAASPRMTYSDLICDNNFAFKKVWLV